MEQGDCNLDAKVKSADVDIHFSHGVVESAPGILHSSLDQFEGCGCMRILVEGWYEHVQGLMNVS